MSMRNRNVLKTTLSMTRHFAFNVGGNQSLCARYTFWRRRGFRGDVDRHYSRLIGFSVLSSLFSAGFQLSQTRRGTIFQNPSPAEIAAGAVGQEISQTAAEITRRNLNVQPTLKIPVGYRFNVRVNRDILFDAPYTPSNHERDR